MLKDLGNSHKELASTILKLIDPVIGQGIASDLVNVQNNSNTFNEYVQHLKTFFDEVYAPLAPAASSYTRWQKQQELIQLKFQALDNKLEKQKEKEVHVVEDRFEKYLKSSLETNIDFLRKGKSFFVIFMLLIGTVITFVYMQTVFMSVSFSFLGLGIGILMILIFRWIIRGVWRRSPDRGLGAVMDPIHRFVGRLVYRPIYKIMKNDPNSNLNIQVHQTKKNEIEKLLLRSEGQKTQEHFAEAVRIMLMNDQSISMELSKK